MSIKKPIMTTDTIKKYTSEEFQYKHPGGALILQNISGSDCTDSMDVLHPRNSFTRYLPSYHIGTVDGNDTEKNHMLSTTCTSIAFRHLHEQLQEKGLFKVRVSYYYRQVVMLTVVFVAMISSVLMRPNSIACVSLSAVLLAFFWQQLAFVGHDLGHATVTGDTHWDHMIAATVGNAFGGISIGWWKYSHYIHHVVTNDPEKDSDIQHLPFITISDKFFSSLYSTYHKKIMRYDLFTRVILPVQQYTFYFFLAFGRVNLYLQSVIYLLTSKEVYAPVAEWIGLGIFWCWFISLLSCLPSPLMIVYYIWLSHTLMLILHLQISLSHFCSEVVPVLFNEESFVLHQLRTTQDIDCPEYLDWMHGGLQFQASHHLFPRIPRFNLRKAQAHIKQFCANNGIEYKTISFWEANLQVLKILSNVGESSHLHNLWLKTN